MNFFCKIVQKFHQIPFIQKNHKIPFQLFILEEHNQPAIKSLDPQKLRAFALFTKNPVSEVVYRRIPEQNFSKQSRRVLQNLPEKQNHCNECIQILKQKGRQIFCSLDWISTATYFQLIRGEQESNFIILIRDDQKQSQFVSNQPQSHPIEKKIRLLLHYKNFQKKSPVKKSEPQVHIF